MIISHIVAVSKNWVIGKNSSLPWEMPSDAQYFHDITMGHPIIMGRKNYEANKGALPGRINIVITRKKDFNLPDAKVVKNIDEAIKIARSHSKSQADKSHEIFIVGGGEIYRQTLEIADRIYITVIDAFVDGDTFYPEIDFSDYNVISEDRHTADDQNPYDWTYFILEPRK